MLQRNLLYTAITRARQMVVLVGTRRAIGMAVNNNKVAERYSGLVTRAMRCAVVKVDKANVRTGPGTQYATSPWGPVEKYYAFKVTGSKGEWVKVQDEVLNDGWVAKRLLWIQ